MSFGYAGKCRYDNISNLKKRQKKKYIKYIERALLGVFGEGYLETWDEKKVRLK